MTSSAPARPFTPYDRARRIDRLARRAHRFHRYAHHPLCASYAGEVLRIGPRTRLCRGCAAVLTGGAAGALGTLLLPSLPGLLVAALGLGAVLAMTASILPRSPPHASRRMHPMKLLTRALPAFLASTVAVGGVRAGSAAGWTAFAAMTAIVALTVLAYRRRGPDRAACEACPERSSTVPCAGLRPIARREAAFRRVASRLLVAPPRPRP